MSRRSDRRLDDVELLGFSRTRRVSGIECPAHLFEPVGQGVDDLLGWPGADRRGHDVVVDLDEPAVFERFTDAATYRLDTPVVVGDFAGSRPRRC